LRWQHSKAEYLCYKGDVYTRTNVSLEFSISGSLHFPVLTLRLCSSEQLIYYEFYPVVKIYLSSVPILLPLQLTQVDGFLYVECLIIFNNIRIQPTSKVMPTKRSPNNTELVKTFRILLHTETCRYSAQILKLLKNFKYRYTDLCL
jgi:hypothetical protein